MIRNGANGFGAAYANAWILAFVANARLAHRTIRIARTLGATAFIRIAVIVANAFTNSEIVFDTATCIVSAWSWHAWILLIAWNICAEIIKLFKLFQKSYLQKNGQNLHIEMDSDLFRCYFDGGGFARDSGTLTLFRLHLRSASNEWIANGASLTLANGDVIKDRTLGTFAARIRARIAAFQIDAGQIAGAFTIHSALGTTIRWDALIFGQTRARWVAIVWHTLGIGTAWAWHAWIDMFNVLSRRRGRCVVLSKEIIGYFFYFFFFFMICGFRPYRDRNGLQYFTYGDRRAAREWITGVISRTNTDSIMIHHTAVSVEATSARTRIDALLIDASLLQRTIRYTHTFGTTVRWNAKVAGQARANRLVLLRQTLAVRTARSRLAWVFVADGLRLGNGRARNVCVSSVTWWAAADREMIQNTTRGG